jgi:hypothetical protein
VLDTLLFHDCFWQEWLQAGRKWRRSPEGALLAKAGSLVSGSRNKDPFFGRASKGSLIRGLCVFWNTKHLHKKRFVKLKPNKNNNTKIILV